LQPFAKQQIKMVAASFDKKEALFLWIDPDWDQ